MIETLISIVVPIVFCFIMFALGITTNRSDFAVALRYPRALLAGLVAQMLALPLITFGFVSILGIEGFYAFGIMILAACPGGVTTNMFTHMAGGRVALSISLTAFTTALTPLTLPLWSALWSYVYLGDAGAEIDTLSVSLQMLGITLLPSFAGLAVREWRPELAEAIGPRLLRIAGVIFWALVIAGIGASWDAIREHLLGLGLVMTVLAAILTALGWFAAQAMRLDRRDRITLAIECGVQNGTVGLTFLGLLFGASGNEIPPAMVPLGLYGFVIFIVIVPFTYIMGRRQGSLVSAG